ncbi:MAG: polyribonucleotide nucleotidyltransferase [Patescibacteria group bacterium]|jgi:polyribonucleotide nucleotidyltransferase
MKKIQKFETEVAGKKLIFEIGHFANQADGACTVQYGDTVVLATAVMNESTREGIDYFPLMVDYEERLYAAGKIKGSRFIKREGRPSDEAILTSRLVDRSVRPLFSDEIRQDVQVVLTVLSVDQENDSDMLSLLAASCALSISRIPWNGPIAGVRVGRINNEWVLNPTYEARDKADMEIVVAGNEEKVLMIEASGQQVQEADILAAVQFGHKHLKKIVSFVKEIQSKIGEPKKIVQLGEPSEEELKEIAKLQEKVESFCLNKIKEVFGKGKKEQSEQIVKLKDELEETLKKDNEVTKEARLKGVTMVDKIYEEAARQMVLTEEKRVDGRKLDEIRELNAEAGVLPRTHGSGVFLRGETQVLSVVTLGSPGDEQLLDTMEESGKKRFMHHYNFPGFSTGEAKPVRSPGRREIGHGALVEKALTPVLPDQESFPYTIRVVSEVLSSNGSSSQASCCGSSLALMDAGVPIKNPVAGIAIGLITENDNPDNFKLITDIQGVEDHNGDMDFKVAGTKNGITAIQMDVKLHGINFSVIEQALERARLARLQILGVMDKAIASPRPELSKYAPRITTVRINPELIRDVIGKGGETINKIIDECGGQDVTKIDIEDDGLIFITSTNAEMATKAENWVKDITREIKVGEVFEGTITQIMKDRNSGGEIGAIVELAPGKDGMVHISEFASGRIRNVSDVVSVGQKLKVKVLEVDKERGRISLSVKALGAESNLVIPSSAIETGGFDRGHGGGFRNSKPTRPPFRDRKFSPRKPF